MNSDELRRLMEVVPDAMIVVDPDGSIAWVNREAEELLGYPSDELTRLGLDSLLPERFRGKHAEHFKAFFASPVVRPMGSRLDLLALCKDGREIPVDIRLSPVKTDRGLLAAASIRDISARKETELRLQAALAEVKRLQDRLSAENTYLREEIAQSSGSQEIVGESPAFQLALDKIDQVAGTDAGVLITGETGTGKGLIAQAIHDRSGRSDRPLIKVNCSALPAGLMESELFGHEEGAFTGATARKTGRFELAHGGTIFLDEIGDLRPELQVKLLRVLQDGEFERIGSSTTTSADVRVVAATNRDLQQAMQEERFRRDLYFRLAVFPIEVPPLRVRRDDIPLLVWHFISKKQARLGKRIDKVPRQTMERLAAYSWPGNVRELENVVERAMIVSANSTLAVDELLATLDEPRIRPATSATIDDVERTHIVRVLNDCNWRIRGTGNAAERLGLPPSTLRYRMKKLGIERP